MRRAAGAAIALACLIGQPVVAADGLTVEELQQLPGDLLLRRTLSQAAARFVEFDRSQIMTGNRLRYATRPRWAGNAGVCEADILTVNLHGTATPDSAEVGELELETRYLAAGDTSPVKDWDEQVYEARCAALPSAMDFFSAPHANSAWAAVRNLETVLSGAVPGGTAFNIKCEIIRPVCDRSVLQGWSIADLSTVYDNPCQPAQTRSQCQTLELHREPDEASLWNLEVKIVYSGGDFGSAPDHPVEIQSVQIVLSGGVVD